MKYREFTIVYQKNQIHIISLILDSLAKERVDFANPFSKLLLSLNLTCPRFPLRKINRILPAFAESRQLQLADKCEKGTSAGFAAAGAVVPPTSVGGAPPGGPRSEEHTSELQS